MNHCPNGEDGMDFVPGWTWPHHSMKKITWLFLTASEEKQERCVRTQHEGHRDRPGSKLSPESDDASTSILNLWSLGCYWNPPAHGSLLWHLKLRQYHHPLPSTTASTVSQPSFWQAAGSTQTVFFSLPPPITPNIPFSVPPVWLPPISLHKSIFP